MPDIVTTQTFVDGEKGITATKMNNIIANSVIQPSFVGNQPTTSSLDPADQLLDLKSTGAYARITGAQLASSVAGQLTLANTSQAGMLHQTSGNIGDYCGGDNLFHILNTYVSLTAATTLTSVDINKLLICSGGSWALTLPAPANGLAYRLRNDMGISGTTGTITVTPTGGTIDGAASLALLPQQECTLLCNGTNWRTFGLKREVILGTQDITTSTASGSVLLPAGYRYYELKFMGFIPVANGDALSGQFSSDGGSTWYTAANYYDGLIYNSSATAAAFSTVEATTSFRIVAASINAASQGAMANLTIFSGSATAPTQVPIYSTDTGSRNSGAAFNNKWQGFGFYNSATQMNALKFFGGTGNIARLSLTVKGVV